MSKFYWACVVVLVLFSFAIANACDCVASGPPCEAFWTADAVFAATVRSKSIITIDSEVNRNEQQVAVKLLVEDVFRGGLGGNDVEVLTGMGGGDCGYNFVKGQRYLVYAHERRGRLYATICSRTKLLIEAGEDLAYFRNLPPENSGGRLLVKVMKRLPSLNANSADIKPMPGVRIIAEASGLSYQGKTNDAGQYEFKDLPPGKYKITSDIPQTEQNVWRTEVTVEDRACSSIQFWNRVEGSMKSKP